LRENEFWKYFCSLSGNIDEMAAPNKRANDGGALAAPEWESFDSVCYIGFRSCKNEMKTLVCPLGYNAGGAARRATSRQWKRTIIKTFCLLACIERNRISTALSFSLKTFGENENTSAGSSDVYFTVVL
jgi:hypothetical protein